MDKEYWFGLKQKQFLKNIDTFYYSVFFNRDFTRETIHQEVLDLRRFCDEVKSLEDPANLYFKMGGCVYYQPGSFSCYSVRFTSPEKFDFFLAPEVATKKTPHAIVQLRSRTLWEDGVYIAVKESLEFVESFAKFFGMEIQEIRENRCDFACHSNYLASPEKFFREENFAKMWVGNVGRNYKDKTREMTGHTTVYDDDELEKDYIALGRRGDKCFVRIYLKSKEVVQQGYKGYFLKMWLLAGMINRYDMYCLEEGYKRRSWTYVETARLKWALQYDDTLTEEDKEYIHSIIDCDKPVYNTVRKAAKKYTRPVTKIHNIEFQCMRDMSKSFELIRKNEGPYARVYDYLDNYDLIYEYLTRVCLRLVRTDSNDSNKARREDTDFWMRLRRAKTVDFKTKHKDVELIRKYNSNINAELRKQRALSTLSSFGYAMNQDVNADTFNDVELLLSTMNDNDIMYIDRHKKKLAMRNTECIPDDQKRKRCVSYYLYDPETGEFYSGGKNRDYN